MSDRTLGEQVGKKQPFESEAQEAHLNMLRSASMLAGPFHAMFKKHRLTDASYNTLRILRGHHLAGETQGVRASRIGSGMVVRVPDVTRIVDRLVAMGLAERHACDQDRRVVFVKITPPGLDVLAQLDEPINELHRSLLDHMSSAELKQLIRLLEKARERVEDDGDSHCP
ncbi:MAG: MarR family transcriptional regulator [Planctomycetota bacterium]